MAGVQLSRQPNANPRRFGFTATSSPRGPPTASPAACLPAGSPLFPDPSPSPSPAYWPALQVLQLADNGLASLAPLRLARLPCLRVLNLSGNELSGLEGLEGLGQLQRLLLSGNRLRAVSGDVLASLGRLKELGLEDCGLKLLAGLQVGACWVQAPAELGRGCSGAARSNGPLGGPVRCRGPLGPACNDWAP